MSTHKGRPTYDGVGPRHLPSRLASSVPAIVLTSLYAALVAWSWRKWPDVLIDVGKEVYVPWRLAEGESLYRDLPSSMGPLSPHINALLFRLFGASFSTLFYTNLFVLAGIAFLIYRLFAGLGSRFAATLVCAVFLGLFGFSQYSNVANYNYVFPYRHEMTHGIALCLLQLLFLVRYTANRRPACLALAGLCLGGVAMTKVELFIAAAGGALLTGALLAFKERPLARVILAQAAQFLAAMIVPALLFAVYLASSMPVSEAIGGTFANWIHAADPRLTVDYPFYRQLIGIDAALVGLTRIALAGGIMAGALAATVVADRLIPLPTTFRRAFQFGIGAGVFYAAWFMVPGRAWISVAAPLPVFSLASTAAFPWLAARNRADDMRFGRDVFLSLWSAVSALLLLKMILNAQFLQYGFVLAMPAALLLVYCTAWLLPEFLSRKWGRGHLCRAVVLGLVAACVLRYWQVSNSYYAEKTAAFGSGGDLIYIDREAAPRMRVIPATTAYLRETMPPDATLLAVPQGVVINYMLRALNPTRHYLLNPWEVLAASGERAVLDDVARGAPDFIVVLQMPMDEHGYTYFGEPEYGRLMLDWIEANYEAVRVFRGLDRRGAIGLQAIIFKSHSLSARTPPPDRDSARPN